MGAEDALACSVRGCGLALARRERGFVCGRGHSFDLARSGYLNLLQPQDRRASSPGDARAEIEARARLHAAGFARSLEAELLRLVGGLGRGLGLARGSLVVDLGAGSGEHLAALCAAGGLAGLGIDLASHAMELAARRFPDHSWVVANADRRLPLRDSSAALVVSLHGRRNPEECARVLVPGGHLLATLPASDDLQELRALVLGQGTARERVGGFVAEHAEHFELRERSLARERRTCTRPELLDLLSGTYCGARRSAAEAIERLTTLEVTLASDVVLLVRR